MNDDPNPIVRNADARVSYADVARLATLIERMRCIAIASIAIGFLTTAVMLMLGGNVLAWIGVTLLGVSGYMAGARSAGYAARLGSITSEAETVGR